GGQGACAAGRQTRGLEDPAVAVGERRRDLPRGNGEREVPRCDDADDPDGLAGDLDVDTRPHRRNPLSLQADDLACEELEDVAGTPRLADALGQRLALLAGEQRPELGSPFEDPRADPVEEIGPLLDVAARPWREKSASPPGR